MYRNELVALISPNKKVLRELGKSLDKGYMDRGQMCDDEQINKIVYDAIKSSGQHAKLKEKEIPLRIRLTHEEWTPDNGLLTAAFKLKRKNVYEFYKEDIKRMFDSIHS